MTDSNEGEQYFRFAKQWQTTFNAISDAIFLLDIDQKILQCNSATAYMLGKPESEIIGKKCHELIHCLGEPIKECPFVRMRQSGKRESIVFQMDERWFDIIADPLRDGGDLTGAVHIMRDITERKQTEKVLRLSEERYRTLAEAAQDAIFIINRDLHFEYVNNFIAKNIFRISPQEIIGKPIWNFFPPDIAEGYKQNLLRVFETGKPVHDENKTNLHGREIWQDAYLTPLKSETGEVAAVLGIARDITERKLAEETLQSIRNRLKFLLSTTPAIIYSSRAGGDYAITFLSENVIDQLGYGPEEVIADPDFWANRIHPEDRQRVLGELELLIKQGHLSLEYRFLHKDGTYRWTYDEFRLVYDTEGKPVEIVGYWIDITGRKMAEELLKEAEERYRTLFEQSPDGVMIIDPETALPIMFNDVACNSLGYSKEEFAKLRIFDHEAIGTPDETKEHIEKILREGTASFETKIRTKDGKIRYVQVGSKPIELSGRTVFNVLFHDITELMQAEEALKSREEYFRFLIENSLDTITILNADGTMRYQSRSAEQIFGYTPEELIGRNVFEFIHPDDVKKAAEALTNGIQEPGIVESVEVRFLQKDGSWRFIESKGKSLLEQPIMKGIVVNSRDITKRKLIEEKLGSLMEELKRSNAELEQFAYIASHDLQEPLRMVASYMQLIERRYKGKLGSDADEFITFAVDGAKRMQEMINDLLQYSRVTTRGKPFEPADCQAILNSALSSLKVAIEESNTVITGDPLPTVNADASQMERVFQNLIGNAIKFRGETPPCIHVGIEKKENEWVFSVKDNCIGFDMSQADRLFKMFQRLQSGAKYPGTGMGLAICKKIVERHGGRIWAESEPGKGSTFYFTIPGGDHG